MKRKVVSFKSLPVRIPIWQTVVLYLMPSKFSAPEWVWASMWTLWGIVLICSVVLLLTQESVDLFPPEKK